METLRQIYDNWFRSGSLPPEITDATVVEIFKKGDPTLPENYRPISLLNTVIKIYATIIKRKIEAGIDAELQPTQFGFRKGKSTIDAIQCIRRLMDKAERGGKPLGIVMIDWEKAFEN